MSRHKRLKYIPFRHETDHFSLKEDFLIVDNPTKNKYVPNGNYLIRGNKKSHSKKYSVLDNVWYLIAETEKDNGHYNGIASTYQLYPNLTDKEFIELREYIRYLKPYMQRVVRGYFMNKELREMVREIKKSFLNYKKK